jgi:hypothetical protein
MSDSSLKSWIVLFGFLAVSSFSIAQDVGWETVRQIPQGERVKIVLNSGKSHKGVLRSVSDNAIALGNTESYPKQDIRRVLVKKSGHRGRNALIGLGIGAGAGLASGAAIDNDCSKTSIICTGNAGKAILTPVFGVLGLGIGAIVPTGGWKETYRSKSE